MSAIISPPAAPAQPPAQAATMPEPYRLSVEQYHAMVEHAIFMPEDRAELIHGLLVKKVTKKPPHTLSTILVRDAVADFLPDGWHHRTKEPITLVDSEPEPDGCVVRGVARDYTSRHPSPADVALVVEVAESSLQYDRTTKKALYAAARIPVYWIVDLVNNQVQIYTDPTGPGPQPTYAVETILNPSDEVALVLNGQEVGRIPVASILP